MNSFLLPLGIFLVLVIFLGIGLTLKPREIPSPLISKAAPAFRVPQLHEESKTFAPEEMRGKVWLFNVWASWCVSCREEHPLLVEFARQNLVPIYGLNYKDKRENALAWLADGGNPYILSAYDQAGNVGIDWGVYGMPETFLMDKQVIMRYKQIGPVTTEALRDKIIPLIKELNSEK